ncbi:MAG TPA: hypothetical protein VF637_08020 [Sphingomicrobium sp.]|jgi:hypothetical protein
MDPVNEIFAAFGNSPTKLARATGLKVQTVCDWRKKTPVNIPEWRRMTVLTALQRDNLAVSPATLQYLTQAAA